MAALQTFTIPASSALISKRATIACHRRTRARAEDHQAESFNIDRKKAFILYQAARIAWRPIPFPIDQLTCANEASLEDSCAGNLATDIDRLAGYEMLSCMFLHHGTGSSECSEGRVFRQAAKWAFWLVGRPYAASDWAIGMNVDYNWLRCSSLGS